MGKIARAAVCALAVLDSNLAFRVRHNKNKGKRTQVATQTANQDPEAASCVASNFLLAAVRAAVNGALNLALSGADPTNVTFHAGQYDIDLLLCSVGLEMDSTIQVSGFSGAHINELSCVKETCLEEGNWGCNKKEYTFGGKILFGDVLSMQGENSADWNLCGVELNDKDVSIGVNSADPGVQVEFVIVREGLAGYAIKAIQGLETNWGELHNFRCGFSALPGFIGSKLESWCASIIQFVAEKSQTHLQEHIDKLLLSLINRIIPSPDLEDA